MKTTRKDTTAEERYQAILEKIEVWWVVTDLVKERAVYRVGRKQKLSKTSQSGIF